MATDNEGLHIKITGDSSQAVKAIQDVEHATEDIKDQKIDVKVDAKVDALGRLHKANGQFMTMGEKLASSFNSAFMKKAAELSVNLSDLGKKVEGVFAPVFKSIAGMASSVAGVISFVTRNALSIGGGFEAVMTSVQVVSSATSEEMQKLTDKAREMGATLPITAQQAGQAMLIMAQRGTKFADILTTVEDVANLSIFQGTDMQTAANLLGSTMSQFSLDTKEASRIVDIFNNACNQSPLNMQLLVDAMQYVGPIAGGMGIKLEEVVAALEALHKSGLVGSMAGTGLRMVYQKIAKEAQIAGVETKNLDGSTRHLSDIFGELKAKGYTVAQATKDFTARGANAAISIMKLSDTLKLYEQGLQQVGTTSRGVNEKMKTFTNTMNAFRSATEELHIEIFTQIKDQAKDAVGSIADLTRQFSKWIGDTQIAGKALDSFLKGLGFNIPNADSFQKLLNSFNVQSFLDSIQSFGSAIKGIADGIVSAFSMIKAPLLFLIEHLGTFATISFWGWIFGKGLQVPAAILSIASAFKTLYASAQLLLSLSWTSFLNPMTIVVGAGTAVAYYAGGKIAEAEKAERDFNDTIKRIQNEIRDADSDLSFSINFDFKTGFEKLPDSYIKASDELRAKTNETVKVLQAAFKDKVAAAVDSVAQKFPNLAAEVVQSGVDIDNLSNDILRQISAVFHGSEEEFKKLHPFFKQVIDYMNSVTLGSKDWNSAVYNITKTYKQLQAETDKLKPQNKVKTFYEELSANLRNVFANLPKQIEEANKFLNGSDGQLAINVSLEKAKSQLDAFVKQAADKFAIPEDIVKQSTINKLQELANQGNKTAQALIKAWGKADTSVEDFIDKAKEAITYLGASPQHFLPALNSMMKNIQKIDPVTGKLTEQFKKAHDALKEWANITFDKLSNRIQKLRKAVEGGFIDSSALENELRRSLPQIKLQVVSELEPIKNQFASQSDYQATIASEIVAKVQDLFGDIGTNLLRNLYDGMKGIDIGQSILRDLGLSGSQGYININGVEQSLNNAVNPLADMLNSFTPTVANARDALSSFNEGLRLNSNVLNNTSDSMISFINSIRTPADIFGNRSAGAADEALSRNSGNVSSHFDYSTQFSNVIQILSSINSNSAASVNALNSLGNSLQSLGPQSLNENNISAAISNGLSPLFDRLVSAVSNNNSSNDALREISTRFDALKSSTDNNLNALLSIENAVKSIEIKPVNENSIAAAVTNGLNPLNSRLEQAISAADNLSKNLISFPALFDALRSNIINHVNALTSLQNSFSSVSNNLNFSSALSPLIASVLKLDSALTSILTVQQNNSNSVLEVLTAVRSLDSALHSLSSGNTYNIDIQQQGFMIERKYDADSLARSTASAIRSGLGNGGV